MDGFDAWWAEPIFDQMFVDRLLSKVRSKESVPPTILVEVGTHHLSSRNAGAVIDVVMRRSACGMLCSEAERVHVAEQIKARLLVATAAITPKPSIYEMHDQEHYSRGVLWESICQATTAIRKAHPRCSPAALSSFGCRRVSRSCTRPSCGWLAGISPGS